ncbi:hypothetical protein GN956_G13311 [Arapaima gigas]
MSWSRTSQIKRRGLEIGALLLRHCRIAAGDSPALWEEGGHLAFRRFCGSQQTITHWCKGIRSIIKQP